MNVLVKMRIGKKIAAYVFEKNGWFYWYSGSPSKNQQARGHDWSCGCSCLGDVYSNALMYCKFMANHFGYNAITITHSVGKHTSWAKLEYSDAWNVVAVKGGM